MDVSLDTPPGLYDSLSLIREVVHVLFPRGEHTVEIGDVFGMGFPELVVELVLVLEKFGLVPLLVVDPDTLGVDGVEILTHIFVVDIVEDATLRREEIPVALYPVPPGHIVLPDVIELHGNADRHRAVGELRGLTHTFPELRST